MYKQLQINEFRQFRDVNLVLGKYLTVLAGRNATGKSTILGILANSGEIKKKDGFTYLNGQFRAEFNEIFHGSKKYDKAGSNRFRIDVVDDSDETKLIDQRFFRTAWQKKDRFRVIPLGKTNEGKKTESKMPIPVLYLGLSRLFPIGEANEDNITTKNIKFLEDEHRTWFVDNYKNILSLNGDISVISNYSIGETEKKKGVGIETEKYDCLTNSSGQDNLGQILMAILSFKKLRKEKPNIKGGLLIIDEIDATLHPSAQERLIDLLINESRKNNFQTVVTTHSSDLLKHICAKTIHNRNEINNNIELYYFTNANRELEIKRNINYSLIESDLLVQSVIQNLNKVKIYSEDKENRWFVKNLIRDYIAYVNLLDVCIGCQQLLSLYSADVGYFGNSILIFDGDVKESQYTLSQKKLRDTLNNIIKLPGDKRPEEVIYDYIIGLAPDHPFWEKSSQFSLTWQYFNDNGPNSPKYSGAERERYKKWFKEHVDLFDSLNLYGFWENDNKEEVEKFRENFIKSYNSIASRTFAIKIQC